MSEVTELEEKRNIQLFGLGMFLITPLISRLEYGT